MTDHEFRMPEMPDFPLNNPPAPEPPTPPAPPVQPAAPQIPPQQPVTRIPQPPVPHIPEIPRIQPLPPVPPVQRVPSASPVSPAAADAQGNPVTQIPPVTPAPQRPVYPQQDPFSSLTQQALPQPPFQQPVPPPQSTMPPVPRTYDDFSPDTKRILALPPITTREAESCRHRLENRWYRRLILLNVFLIMLTIGLVMTSMDDYRKQVAELTASVLADAAHGDSEDDEDYEETSQSDYEEFAQELPLGFQMLSYGIALMTIGYIALYYLNAQVRSRSIRITEHSFPELHALIRSYAARLGVPIPDAYIVSENGVLNAFSAFIYRRQYIQINSEIVEVAYREHRDMNALAFIIAHEMAHIYYGHATLHYNVWIWFSTRLPLFSQIASRTREYSCDRLAQRLTNYDGLGAMLMLIADRHLYHMVDVQDYLNGAARENGFFIWLVNMFSDHPIMTKRIRALADWNGHGELY